MKPYFSIIIPTRTIGPMIVDEALPALASQTCKEFEVFVVPDTSDARERNLKKTYEFLTILHPKDKSRPGDKRDFGAKHAHGEVLVFVDDDVFPTKKWLEHAHRIFTQKNDIAALGGPGLLPPHANMWEKMIDGMLKTWIGSGRYTYRFTPRHAQFVDDYPSMNLMIRAEVFKRIGGFDNQHWPGEDSKLLNKFKTKENRYIYYHPKVAVYHHRRRSFWEHTIQHVNYGKTRGKFAAQGDANSRSIMYTIPAFFVLYLLFLMIGAIGFSNLLPFAFLPLYLYFALMSLVFFHSFWHSESIITGVGSMLFVPVTHIAYGAWFIVGYIREKIQNLK